MPGVSIRKEAGWRCGGKYRSRGPEVVHMQPWSGLGGLWSFQVLGERRRKWTRVTITMTTTDPHQPWLREGCRRGQQGYPPNLF